MTNYFWFRRDLRLHDNRGLYHALKSETPVQCVFIFDKQILSQLDNPSDPRVTFIHNEVKALHDQLKKYGSTLQIYYGNPLDVWKSILSKGDLHSLFLNHDYEPYAIQRDKAIRQLIEDAGRTYKSYKDHVIFEKLEVAKSDATPYTVFTPYKRKWLETLNNDLSRHIGICDSQSLLQNTVKSKDQTLIPIDEIGFSESSMHIPSRNVSQKLIKNYDDTRDIPSIQGTSQLGIHFRFGTISIRDKVRKAMELNDTFLSELIWRDFYAQILCNYPYVAERSFREKYDRIEWRNNEKEFSLWCSGKTGYPMVDAGMRELNQTGFMHNRVRMLTASFLTKHLLIDWRWGEQYFADKLLDYDLASNNGGWQWAAGCGTDAAPYFRIFNPTIQLKKFDPDLVYVKKWIPEYGSTDYPEPIVDHKLARERCLQTYKSALS